MYIFLPVSKTISKKEIGMRILFYDTKTYDRRSFEAALEGYEPLKNSGVSVQIEYIRSDLEPHTAMLAEGFDAVCAFVSSDVGTKTVELLHEKKVKLILMRCAGFNNVDLEKAKELGIRVMRVPGYSPEAVAEHAMALALAVNRRLHKAYNKVRENDFSLNGLMGFNFYQKTAGIIGTGKIGAAMCRICHGFGMRVIAYDVYENAGLKEFVEYLPLEQVLAESDLLSLHCPLSDSTYHLINLDTIRQMKDGVILVNTSRGALVKTQDLIEGIRMHKFGGVGLDVYEEETNNVFEDRSDEILEHSTTARLLSFPHVVITSHQGFFTREALMAIAETTLQNALDFAAGRKSVNEF
jgi:D-lactate dehydrogenase